LNTTEEEPSELTTTSQETFQINSDISLETTTQSSSPFISDDEEFDFGKFSTSSELNRNLSDILFDKARARPQHFKDSTDGLSVPSEADDEISSTPIFIDENSPTPFFVDQNSPTPIFFEGNPSSLESTDVEGSTESTTEHQVTKFCFLFRHLNILRQFGDLKSRTTKLSSFITYFGFDFKLLNFYKALL
jgi:hypothetical protein